MNKERLEELRNEWLQLHDRQTGGVVGLFPGTWNLPLRFTHTLDKKNKVVKYALGRFVGWELQDVDAERVAGSTDAELVLRGCREKSSCG